MFNSVSGRITGHEFPLIFIATGGVEWELEVSAATFQSVLGAAPDSEVRVFTHLHAREDALKLYGFWRASERVAFRELLTVSGIGPRQALRILSGTTVKELTALLEHEDLTALTRIPGLGKKTAQKMILQLKGALVTDAESTRAPADEPTDPSEELVAALVEMGFDRAASRKALEAGRKELTSDDSTEVDEQELFRKAIVALSAR